MRLLLDTHAFLWAIGDDPRLSGRVRRLLEDPATDAAVSLATLWEIVIKVGTKRLRLPPNLAAFFDEQLTTTGLELLMIDLSHVIAVRDLPLHHRDPFDRMLIAQSRVEGMRLVSNDRQFTHYPVDLVW